MSRISNWGSKLLYAGALGLGLSVVLAEYTSQFLYAHYQTWAGWRSITGTDPNSLTSIVQKLTWAIFFFSAWLMLWKLDYFFQSPLLKPESDKEDQEKKEEKVGTNKTSREGRNRDQRDQEVQEEEQVLIESKDEIPKKPGEYEEKFKKIIFSKEDYKYAEILGLEEPVDIKIIKSTYRKIIAQYHPDRVVAMGPEIQEVADKKAKEINEAYEFLRKKFDIN
jgi:hypothetical protein